MKLSRFILGCLLCVLCAFNIQAQGLNAFQLPNLTTRIFSEK